MKKQLTVSDYVSGRIGKVIEDCKREDSNLTTLANNLKFLQEELSLINDSFPAEISSKKEQKFIQEVVNESQNDIAKEFIDKEPELRYTNELTPAEAFNAFQDYMIKMLAQKTARKVFDEHYSELFQMRYESLFGNNTFRDFKRLYDRNKE